MNKIFLNSEEIKKKSTPTNSKLMKMMRSRILAKQFYSQNFTKFGNQPAAFGGRRRLYSLLTMRDSLTIKIDVKLILVGFKS